MLPIDFVSGIPATSLESVHLWCDFLQLGDGNRTEQSRGHHLPNIEFGGLIGNAYKVDLMEDPPLHAPAIKIGNAVGRRLVSISITFSPSFNREPIIVSKGTA